ncbi:MAG: hypothetical protein IJ710_08985 [Prevotella sp.]|nr:hypothetical protein [Prevotella sp.]
MKLTKNRFLMGFVAVVAVLAVVRVLFPAIAMPSTAVEQETETLTSNLPPVVEDRVLVVDAPHRIFSVANYQAAFPDSNSVQLVAAHRNGVSPVKNREDAEMRKKELVFVGSNPYYHVDRLTSSIPYLVPRAAVLLQDIGRAFYDSLYVKGVPLHQLIVTSVLRSEDDVRRLRLRNGNATENSCHLYGTTFDICYNRYRTVEDPDGPARRAVRNDTLKWVLSEVLRDFRQQERCYIKYEVKQGCFHLTVN